MSFDYNSLEPLTSLETSILFEIAMNGSPDNECDEHYCNATYVLSRRFEEIFPQVQDFLSGNTHKRRIALDIMIPHFVDQETFAVEFNKIVVSILDERPNLERELIPPILRVLQEMDQPGWIDLVLPLASDPDPGIRYAVVTAFRNCKDERAINALILLSNDVTPKVRSHAISEISYHPSRVINNKALCDALADRLNDVPEIKLSALAGLVCGRDVRGVEPLREHLKTRLLTGTIREAVRSVCHDDGYGAEWLPVFRDLAAYAFKMRAVYTDSEAMNMLSEEDIIWLNSQKDSESDSPF